MKRETSLPRMNQEPSGRPIEVRPEDELEFQDAVEQYKRQSGRQFPTWSEVLEVLQGLGYAKRIWQPVGVWSPLPPSTVVEELGGEIPAEMAGWSAAVETSTGP